MSLAPYAVKKSQGRKYPEKEDTFRGPFERDRNRVIHSKAFRRLAGKTQVFVATFGDHYRDRLSHTLEVSQIARDIARRLKVNEDLAEAIALAHDLGHPPFAHAGEEELNRIMKKFHRHFEHNEQSKRIVELLEDRYPDFPGLNLTIEVREGLAKHQTHYDQRGRTIAGKTIEAQIADLADEIAYHNHDLDDGFRSRIFSFKELRTLALWKKAEKEIHKQYPAKYLRYLGISKIISMMTKNVCETTLVNIRRFRIREMKDVVKFPRSLCCFSSSFAKDVAELRKFLFKKMYCAPRVTKHSKHGQKIIRMLFNILYKKPDLLPFKLQAKLKTATKEVVIKDYIAGMTDSFAAKLYAMPKMQT